MKIQKRGLTIALGLAVLAILTLGQMSAVGILAISVGTFLLLLGLWISYRPAAVFGFMTLAVGSGLAVDFDSVTDVSTLMSAAVGILIPVYITGWVALSSEIDGPVNVSIFNRPTLLTIGYTMACVFSVPVASLVIGVLTPAMATHVNVVTEAALMLLVIAILVVALTSRNPRAVLQEPAPEEEASEAA